MYHGKDTTLKTLETMCNARSSHKKNVGKSFAKGRNMQLQTMLAVVGQRCGAVNTRHTLPGPTDSY